MTWGSGRATNGLTVKTEHLIRLIRQRIAETPDTSPCAAPAAGLAGNHLPGAGRTDRRRRLLADRRWRRAGRPGGHHRAQHAGVDVADLAIMSVGADPGADLRDEHPGAGCAHRLGCRRAPRLRRERRTVSQAGRRPRRGRAALTRVVVFDQAAPLDGDDSCHLRTCLAHPVSPEVAARGAAASVHDIATIIYTSGTTGEPKGAVLTFDNLSTQFEAVDAFFRVTTADRSLCFLPLSHAYERIWTFYILAQGRAELLPRRPEARRSTRCARCGRRAW